MKSEMLLEKIGEIAEAYVVEASPVASKKANGPWLKWAAAAAGFVILLAFALGAQKLLPTFFETALETAPTTRASDIAAVTAQSSPATALSESSRTSSAKTTISEPPGTSSSNNATKLPDLPLLTPDDGKGSGMGREAYIAYDISELLSDNPWRESSTITTLPVYENPYPRNTAGLILDSYKGVEKMKRLLLTIAERLHWDTAALEINERWEASGEKMRQASNSDAKHQGQDEAETVFFGLWAEQGGAEISVDPDLTAKILFDPPLPLPPDYPQLTFPNFEQVRQVAAYTKDEYAALLGLENPLTDISGGDYYVFRGESKAHYGVDEAQRYQIRYYEKGESELENILNYNFNYVSVGFDELGELFLIRFHYHDLSKKIADYPIITLDEARELLQKNECIPKRVHISLDMQNVKRAELIYRTHGAIKQYMPYYRFLVEEPTDMWGIGRKLFVAYYVPAVEQQYLDQRAVWDGRFNR